MTRRVGIMHESGLPAFSSFILFVRRNYGFDIRRSAPCGAPGTLAA